MVQSRQTKHTQTDNNRVFINESITIDVKSLGKLPITAGCFVHEIQYLLFRNLVPNFLKNAVKIFVLRSHELESKHRKEAE